MTARSNQGRAVGGPCLGALIGRLHAAALLKTTLREQRPGPRRQGATVEQKPHRWWGRVPTGNQWHPDLCLCELGKTGLSRLSGLVLFHGRNPSRPTGRVTRWQADTQGIDADRQIG